MTLRGLTVDGDGQGNSNNRFVGIAYHNAGGTIDGVEVKNIRHTPFNGVQGGTGIYGYANDAASPHTLTVRDSFVHDYQKNGITMSGAGLTAHVTGNTVTGAGPTDQIAQNGIQFSLGATGTIEGNTVSGHRYTGASTRPPRASSCPVCMTSR